MCVRSRTFLLTPYGVWVVDIGLDCVTVDDSGGFQGLFIKFSSFSSFRRFKHWKGRGEEFQWGFHGGEILKLFGWEETIVRKMKEEQVQKETNGVSRRRFN